MKTLRSKRHLFLIEELRLLRLSRNMTQATLAELLGKPQSYVAKIENHERRIDTVEFVAWLEALEALDHTARIANGMAKLSGND